MRIFLLMKEGCDFDECGLFVGSVASCKHKIYDGAVLIQEKGGKTHRVPEDQIAFLGTVFRDIEMKVIDNLEEAEAESKSNLQEGDNNLDEEAEDGISVK